MSRASAAPCRSSVHDARVSLTLLSCVLACGAPAPPAAAPAPAPEPDTAPPVAPSPWVYESEAEPPAVTPAEVGAAWQATVQQLTRLHAMHALTAWDDARALGDAACPREVTQDSEASGRVTYWDDICTARGRYWFNGPLATYAFEDQSLDRFEINDFFRYRLPGSVLDPDARWSGRAMRGQTEVYDTGSDLHFFCACVAVAADLREPAPRRGWFSYIDGPVRWQSPTAAASWLDEGLQLKLFLLWVQVSDSTWRARASGAVTGLPGRFDTVELDLDVTGGFDTTGAPVCRSGTAGDAAVRVPPTGARVGGDLSFDGDSCIACASLGGAQERACADLSPLLSWENAPW